jgi:hypothetical protein
MAITPNKFLNANSNITLRDPQHAARLFADDSFRLAPKQKYLFHVAFSINPGALKSIDLVQRHRNEINMLVKSIDLPKFNIQTEMLNQYNRKKVVQYQHKPDAITVKFHDDNMGLINQVWQNYYSYYYADSTSAEAAGSYNRNATRSSDFITKPYGLDNRSSTPFFNQIIIYQMARHEYVSYTLKNPLITTWSHGQVATTDGGFNEKSMSLSYEAVSYGSGLVSAGSPEGFGLEHYDTTPSPLQPGDPAGVTSTSPSFTASQNVVSNASQFVSNLTNTVNTYQNTQRLANAGTPGLLTNLLQSAQQGVSGLQGIAFPVARTVSTTVAAIIVKLGN